MTALRVRIHRGRSGLKELRESWRALNARQSASTYPLSSPAAESATPAVSHYHPGTHFGHLPELYAAYLGNIASAPDDVYFCALHDGDELVAVLPLEHSSETVLGQPLSVLRLPQHVHLSQTDFTVAPGYTG
ncbi:MAG: hypothetical protein AAGC55_13425, partial [Myxococcota bacterium]